jgi:hypothetical protein
MLSKKCFLLPCFPFMSWSESGWWYLWDRESEWFHFATVLLHENPSSSQLHENRHSDNQPSTEQDRIHACHCMSLPLASQNAQCYLQAGYGLACAVASAEMALFVGALSFAVPSVWGNVLCGSILSEACLLRFGLFGASSFWFNPFGASSFAVSSVGGVVFAVPSVGGLVFCISILLRRVFCGSICWRPCLLC